MRALCVVLLLLPLSAAGGDPAAPRTDAAAGWRVGQTGLVLGGFATAEAERLEGERGRGELEGNLFVFFEPTAALRLFAELELPDAGLERAYADLSANDALNLRLGKFLTPVGRWNLAHVEPLVWTTSEPLIVETVFDDTVSGAMVHGSVFPSGGALSYALYGSLLDSIATDADEAAADRLAGVHLEWASLSGWTAGASYLASKRPDGVWNHLGGVDLLWQPHPRLELSGEAVFGEGSREGGRLAGFYAQAALELVPTLYAVGRYERLDPPGELRSAHLFDAGLAWVPRSRLRIKADYLFADDPDGLSEPGARASLAILF